MSGGKRVPNMREPSSPTYFGEDFGPTTLDELDKIATNVTVQIPAVRGTMEREG